MLDSLLSSLLDLAGFYLPPFRIKSEKSIEISLEDEGVIVKGQIDVLAVCEQFWVGINDLYQVLRVLKHLGQLTT